MKVNSINALAKGFKDAGVGTSYNFPGFYSHELFKALGEDITSVNEKIAYEFAWGSSIAGSKTVVAFKNVGLHDAMDPFLNSYRTGVNAGLVVVVFDDINLTGSQGIFDSRLFRLQTRGVWLEPKTIQECYDYAYRSFQDSEFSKLPVVIRMSNSNVELVGMIKCSPKTSGDLLPYNKDFEKNVVHPTTGNDHFDTWFSKSNDLRSSLDTSASGFVPNFLLGESLNLESFIKRNYVNSGHIITEKFEKLYGQLRKLDYIVSMDLGGYTVDDKKTADLCLCFGSATAVAGGVKRVLPNKRIAAIIGDTPFLHSGKNSIPELLQRRLSIDIFLMDNGGSQGTGGQKIPGDITKEVQIYGIEYIKIELKDINTLGILLVKPSENLRLFHVLYT